MPPAFWPARLHFLRARVSHSPSISPHCRSELTVGARAYRFPGTSSWPLVGIRPRCFYSGTAAARSGLGHDAASAGNAAIVGSGSRSSGADNGTRADAGSIKRAAWAAAVIALTAALYSGLVSGLSAPPSGKGEAAAAVAPASTRGSADDNDDDSRPSVAFERRRYRMMKQRILEHALPPLTKEGDPLSVGFLERPAIISELLERCTDPLVISARDGDGTSTMMRAWARANPHLIYIDVGGLRSYSEGVKAVAEALGYTTELSAKEQRQFNEGYSLPKVGKTKETAMGMDELSRILELYVEACWELRREGKLAGRGRQYAPTIVLDHSTHPLTEEARHARADALQSPVETLDAPEGGGRRYIGEDTLIRVFFDAAKESTAVCRLCIVANGSDAYTERGAILSSAPWDFIRYWSMPAFTRNEAETLVARGIHKRLRAIASSSSQQQSGKLTSEEELTAEAEAAIKSQYSKTIAFLIDAIGCRPRRLLRCLHFCTPMTDAELDAVAASTVNTTVTERAAEADDVRVPEDLKPLLPIELRDRLVSPGIASALRGELKWFKRAIREMVRVPFDIRVPPAPSPSPPSSERLLERVLMVDSLLRAMLQAPADKGLSRSSVELMFMWRPAVLDRLLYSRVLHCEGSCIGAVTFGSPAARSVTAAVLDSEVHKNSMELARTLQEWQHARSDLASEQQRWRSLGGVPGDAVGLSFSDYAKASARVSQLETRIAELRALVANPKGF